MIRPFLLYGSKYWPALSWHIQEPEEAKVGVWCNADDRIRNTCIRGRDIVGVRYIADKVWERCFRLYGHSGRQHLDMSVSDVRPFVRSRKRWLDDVMKNVRASGCDVMKNIKDRGKCPKADRVKGRDNAEWKKFSLYHTTICLTYCQITNWQIS